MAILTGVSHDEIRRMIEETFDSRRLRDDDVRALLGALVLEVAFARTEERIREIVREEVEEAFARQPYVDTSHGELLLRRLTGEPDPLEALADSTFEARGTDPGLEARAARADVDARARALETRAEVERLLGSDEAVILRSAAKTPEGAVPTAFRLVSVAQDEDGITVELRGDAPLPKGARLE